MIDTMKNYKVMATRYFRDSNEIDEKTGQKKERQVNDVFYCTKERYEYLKENNAVKLVKIQETIESVIEEEKEYVVPVKQMEELVEKAIIEKPKKKKPKKK